MHPDEALKRLLHLEAEMQALVAVLLQNAGEIESAACCQHDSGQAAGYRVAAKMLYNRVKESVQLPARFL